jgi:2-haloalkanoic acid dehalogenase type II
MNHFRWCSITFQQVRVYEMDLRDVTVLSFDCYGTLIDWDAGLIAQLRRISPDLDEDDALQRYAGIEADIEHTHPTMLYRDVVAATARQFGQAIGVPVPDELAADIGGSIGTWPAFPDSAEALAALKPHCTLVVLSNVDRLSFAGSAALLGDPFDTVLTAEEIGSYKPDRRNFEALMAHVDAIGGTGRHLHVAQSLFHDHVPAKAMGLPTAWINRRGMKTSEGASGHSLDISPDWEFPDMHSFAAALLADR